jgi:hypothetical protein
MSNESNASEPKNDTDSGGKPATKTAAKKAPIKARQKKAAAKKAAAKKPAAKKPAAKKERPELPRGFESEEATARVAQAHKTLAKLYPSMTEKQRITYLAEVGAGRYMALRRFEAE